MLLHAHTDRSLLLQRQEVGGPVPTRPHDAAPSPQDPRAVTAAHSAPSVATARCGQDEPAVVHSQGSSVLCAESSSWTEFVVNRAAAVYLGTLAAINKDLASTPVP